jgi:hypothetical protein
MKRPLLLVALLGALVGSLRAGGLDAPLSPAPSQGSVSGPASPGISLQFSQADVRAVLESIADFSGVNIVPTESVTGTVSLRVEDVPWERALELVLASPLFLFNIQSNSLNHLFHKLFVLLLLGFFCQSSCHLNMRSLLLMQNVFIFILDQI